MSFSNLLLWFQFQNDVLTYAIDDQKKHPKNERIRLSRGNSDYLSFIRRVNS